MNQVSAIGPSSAKIMVVGDYPNQDEIGEGICLSGKAGGQISSFLRPHAVKLDDVYRTHVIKLRRQEFGARKVGLRKKAFAQVMDEYPFVDRLRDEINAIKPNVILGLGELTLNTLCNQKGLDAYRGSILKLDPFLKLPDKIKYVPTLHPRDLWKQYEFSPIVQNDYKRAVKYSHSQLPFQPKGVIWYIKDLPQLQHYWGRAQNGEFLTLDVETYRGYITCIGFCHDGKEAVSVPMWDWKNSAEQAAIWKLVYKILSSNVPKVNQNIKYDMHYLEKWGFYVNNVVGDTSLAARIIYPEYKVRIAFLQSLYTELPYHKDESWKFDPRFVNKEQLYHYNAKDCISAWQIHKGQMQDAKDLGVAKFYQANYWDNGLFHIYRKMDGRGILIDNARRDQLRKKYTDALQKQLEVIEFAYGRPLNPRSTQQVRDFVYDFLGCEAQYKRVNEDGIRELDTGKEALEELYINKVKDEATKSLLRRIVLVRKIETLLHYLDYVAHPDGRMRASTKLNGTKSGRTSQTTFEDSLFYLNEKGHFDYKEFGGSLQVIPKRKFEMEELEGEVFGSDIPSMFVPTPGYVFVEGDGSAAEARVVAVLSEDYETLHMMNTTDIHRVTATWTRQKVFDAITEFEREVYGKRPRHAGNYDMGEYRLSQMVHLPVSLCRDILIRFHAAAPKIRGIFHMMVRQAIDQYGVLVSPHGRHRQFAGFRNNDLYKEAYSMIPQATVSDHTKFTMPLLQKDVRSVEFLLEKHDSLLMEVPRADLYYCAEKFKKHMERPISFRTQGTFRRDFELVIPAEIKYSEDNWLEMKKIKLT